MKARTIQLQNKPSHFKSPMGSSIVKRRSPRPVHNHSPAPSSPKPLSRVARRSLRSKILISSPYRLRLRSSKYLR